MCRRKSYPMWLKHEFSHIEHLEVEPTYCIQHHYDIGDQRVYVRRVSGNVDIKKAAVYCQFKCEEWFGAEKMLSNLGVASLLVTFYGFQHTSVVDGCDVVDMHLHREESCGAGYYALMADETLYRDKLKEYMETHVIG